MSTMLPVHPNFITDTSGNRISVILPVQEFETIMEALEELEDIRLYDNAKAEDDGPSLPIDEAFAQIEFNRRAGL